MAWRGRRRDTDADGDEQNGENVANAVYSVLNGWIFGAWRDVEVPIELKGHRATYVQESVMGDAGDLPWADGQACAQGFLEAWRDAALRPGNHPQKPYATPPKWMNKAIINLQLVAAVQPDRLDRSTVLQLDDFIRILKRSRGDDPNGLIPICQALGDRTRLSPVEVGPGEVLVVDAPRSSRRQM